MGQVKLGAEVGRGGEETGVDDFGRFSVMLAKKQRRDLVRKAVANAQKV